MNASEQSRAASWLMGVGASLIAARCACCQTNGLTAVVSNHVSPDAPSATINVWTYFDPGFYAFSAVNFDFMSSPDAGFFHDPTRILDAPGTSDGVIGEDGDSVLGIAAGQLHFPDAGIFADTANPILMWQVTWTTSDFTPRRVDLRSLTYKYSVYFDINGVGGNVLDSTFQEVDSYLMVVPAPASIIPIVTMAMVLGRERR